MKTNDKGRVVIHSFDELPQGLQKQIRLASLQFGTLVLLIAVLAFLAFGTFPNKHNSLFFYCIDWLLFVASPLGAFGVGACIGFELMLARLGFALPHGPYSPSLNQSFSSYDSPNFQHVQNYGSPVSINPSSGRPMSGSSGVDIAGNPYGTRSW
jgi:hypothetical protein